MPTIAELLLAYRDRTGASYAEMARKVRDEIQISRLQQLATAPPKEFPKQARTIELLAELLEVPVATIVLAFAAGLGIPVASDRTLLEQSLPPGTDLLDDEDRDAVRHVVSAMVRARRSGLVHMASGRGHSMSLAAFAEAAIARGDIDAVVILEDGARVELEAKTVERAGPGDYALAARRGMSEGRRLRDEQDADAES